VASLGRHLDRFVRLSAEGAPRAPTTGAPSFVLVGTIPFRRRHHPLLRCRRSLPRRRRRASSSVVPKTPVALLVRGRSRVELAAVSTYMHASAVSGMQSYTN
jgi:hypothetical protein